MFESSRLLTAGPMARRLRVPVAWLRSEAQAGRLPHVRAGQIYLFHPKSVEDVLIERARQSRLFRKAVKRGR